MTKSVTLSVQSLTGNTRKIADAVRIRIQQAGWTVIDHQHEDSVSTDALIVCFWCDKSNLDPRSRELIDSCKNKRVLVFGTMGGYPNSPYAQKVIGNVSEVIDRENECLGVYLSQGKVSMRNVEMRLQLPEDHPHHLDAAGVARLEESQKHPDAADIEGAVEFLEEHLEQLLD